jgi:hypothetical protein
MTTRRMLLAACAVGFGLTSGPLMAQQASVQLNIKDHKFSPAEAKAPANTPLVIVVKNLDPTPAEFESKTLRVEKVVAGGAEVSINIRALAPGRYRFFDEYNEKTAFGFLVVE